MKIMEIIKPIEEAISLTAYNHELYNKLSELAEHRIKADIYKSGSNENTVPTLAIEFHSDNAPGWLGVRFKQGMSYDDCSKVFGKFVRHSYDYWILGEYGKICSNIIGHPIKLFTDKPSSHPGAAAGYDYIIYYVDVDDMISRDMRKILEDTLSAGLFDENNKLADVVELKNLLGDYHIYDFRLYDWLSESVQLDNTIHELVHIKQHLAQKPGRTEYRSKVEPNKKKFAAAVGDLSNPTSYDIYASSLQETPAHAHDAASQIIRSIDFPWDGGIHSDPSYIRKQVEALLMVIRVYPIVLLLSIMGLSLPVIDFLITVGYSTIHLTRSYILYIRDSSRYYIKSWLTMLAIGLNG